MKSFYWFGLAMLLTACGGLEEKTTSNGKGKLVCDTWFIYELCAQDYTGDGQLDLLYFDDTKEILMYRMGTRELVQEVLPLHVCARAMEQTTVDAGTKMLYAGPEISFIELLGYKRTLAADYLAAQDEVRACNKANGIDAPLGDPAEDDFGNDEDMADF